MPRTGETPSRRHGAEDCRRRRKECRGASEAHVPAARTAVDVSTAYLPCRTVRVQQRLRAWREESGGAEQRRAQQESARLHTARHFHTPLE